MDTPPNPEIANYLKELKHDVHKGLLTQEEYNETLVALGLTEKKKSISDYFIEDINLDDPTVSKLETLYYREIFGRKKRKKDSTLINEVLVGKVGLDVAGAIWYCDEPTPDYKKCVYIDMMLVLPEYRGSGLGSRLLHQVLERTPSDHCLITYAWKPSIDFYRKHGFLTTEQESDKEDQFFQKMVLPLTKKSFDRYCREKAGNYFEGLEEIFSVLNKRCEEDFLSDFVNAVSNLSDTEEEHQPLSPFTVFIYDKCKLKHPLLSSYNSYNQK
ncbi:GNAT family N-acetyltransferase [Candidatus Woesearchaeota archaeon]|nr:GNAT family N-acetyltransferase [Candidatus Woesearchaeota archaeon]